MIEKLTFIASYKSQFFDDLDLLIFDFCCVDKQAHPNNCKFIFQGSGFSKLINGLVSPEKKNILNFLRHLKKNSWGQ